MEPTQKRLIFAEDTLHLIRPPVTSINPLSFSLSDNLVKIEGPSKALDNRVTVEPAKNNEKPIMQMIWKNNLPTIGWSNEAPIYSKQNTQLTNVLGTSSISEYYPLKVRRTFYYEFNPSLDVLFGILDDGIPPILDKSYWISILTETQSGVLKIPLEGQRASVFYLFVDDTSHFFIAMPTFSANQTIVFADGNTQYAGFSIWDFSKKKPKCLFQASGYESRTFEIENRLVAGFRRQYGKGILELWDLKDLNAPKKIWNLDGNWFKGGDVFSFNSYIPERNLLIGVCGETEIYAFDVAKKKLLWSNSIVKFKDYFCTKQLIANKFLVCLSHNQVDVYSAVTGALLNKFEIGGNNDINLFPLAFSEECAFSLDKNNINKIVKRDLNTGKFAGEFEIVPKKISELYKAGKHIIGIPENNSKNRGKHSFYVWDIETGKMCKELNFESNQNVSIIDISEHLVTFNISHIPCSAKIFKRKTFTNEKPLSSSDTYQKQYREGVKGLPMPAISTLHFKIWNANTTEYVGQIIENLNSMNVEQPMGCSFKNGNLIVNWLSGNLLRFYARTYDFENLKKKSENYKNEL
jgi:hypothetical protein